MRHGTITFVMLPLFDQTKLAAGIVGRVKGILNNSVMAFTGIVTLSK